MKTIVIPVNCQGTMGKGLALQCAKRHPTVRTRYRYLCEHKMFEPGSVHVCYVSEQREIALAATKDSWRKPSRVEWVERILDGFGGVTAIIWGGGVAFPKLGCGLGGLDWDNEIKPLLIRRLSIVEYPVEIYE